ncbi:MAG: hypothetical protein ACRDRJ_46665, partial [Streptosporangiaceae bacterium]
YLVSTWRDCGSHRPATASAMLRALLASCCRLALAVITLAISVYGHATIVRLYLPFTVALAAIFVVLSAYVLSGHTAPGPARHAA